MSAKELSRAEVMARVKAGSLRLQGEACLMHMVDDATGTVHCQFSEQETIWAAVHVLRRWIEWHGVPRTLYTDWKNVYVRAASEREQREGTVPVTQYGRKCQRLGIRIIAASSPQGQRAGGTRSWHASGQHAGDISIVENAGTFLLWYDMQVSAP